MISHKNLVHFKSDGVVWEMKFSKTTTHLFGKDTEDTAYVRGGCYTEASPTRVGEPCFRSFGYLDPDDAIYEDKYTTCTLSSTAEEEKVGLIYKSNYIKSVLEEVVPLSFLNKNNS